ncbi:hypothetical protein EDC59_102247 [Pseudodesulfovibrio indicus]|uniref:Uncharacterized protein n=1 Tax=Pseudodesulfovibrio indicus TaxID=1716143 RepID=A0AA94TLD5_9BACT|nr:hypothetical protein EDC59_102247 [Pseudodesulfovibrio indicus]
MKKSRFTIQLKYHETSAHDIIVCPGRNVAEFPFLGELRESLSSHILDAFQKSKLPFGEVVKSERMKLTIPFGVNIASNYIF